MAHQLSGDQGMGMHGQAWQKRFSSVVLLLAGLLLAGPAVVQGQAYRLKELATAAQSAPGKVAPQMAYAEALLRAGQVEKAVARFELAARIDKESPAALFEVARALFKRDNYNRSKAACRKLEKAHPGDAYADLCLAAAHLSQRRASRALPILSALTLRAPDLLRAQLLLGDAQRLSGVLDQAAATYDRLLARPGLPAALRAQALLGKARLSQLRGDHETARSLLKQAVEADPHDPELQYDLGLLSPGEVGLGHLEQALEGRPDFPEVRVELARRLVSLGRFADAQAALGRIERDPASRKLASDLKALQGRVWLGLGQTEKAEEALSAAVTESPTDAAAALALAQLYEQTDRPDEALDQYQSAASLMPRDPAPLLAAGRLALALQRPTHAVGLLQLAARQHRDSAAVQALLGDALLAVGDREKAKLAYRAALAQPKFPGQADVARKLAQLEGK